MPEHSVITDPDIHEPKGVAAASDGQVYVANGAGSGAWTTGVDSLVKTGTAGQIVVANGAGIATAQTGVRMGWEDFNDTATTTTPIVLTTAGAHFNLTNNGAGPQTNTTYKIPGKANVWNTSTNRFDFTDLALGDTVLIRWDLTFETMGANHEIDLRMRLAEGTGSQYELSVFRQNYKTAAIYNETGVFFVYMGDAATRDNPALFQVASDTGTTDEVVVNGWVTQTTIRSNY